MKFQLLIITFLALLCYIAADEGRGQGRGRQRENNGHNMSRESSSSSSTGSSQQNLRMRRSPPRFDPNHMKGKFAKANKMKRSADQQEYYYQTTEGNQQQDGRGTSGYFDPTPAMAWAPEATTEFKFPTTTQSV